MNKERRYEGACTLRAGLSWEESAMFTHSHTQTKGERGGRESTQCNVVNGRERGDNIDTIDTHRLPWKQCCQREREGRHYRYHRYPRILMKRG